MHTKDILVLLALASSIIAAPLASQKSGLTSAPDNRNDGGDSTGIWNENYLKEVFNGNVKDSNDQDSSVFADDNAAGNGNARISIFNRGSGSGLNDISGAAHPTGDGNINDENANGNPFKSGHGDNNVSGNENSIGRDEPGLNIPKKVRKERDTTTTTPTHLSPTPTESAYINGVWVAIKDVFASSLPSGQNSKGNYASSVPPKGNGNVIGNDNGNNNILGNNNQVFSNISGVKFDPIINLPTLTAR
ncbi:hypothetical protein MFRU_002g00070 [Monilinia fructicola]|nr:hypothetical protein MFRU_002g00070 [Monilinia fructicola]